MNFKSLFLLGCLLCFAPALAAASPYAKVSGFSTGKGNDAIVWAKTPFLQDKKGGARNKKSNKSPAKQEERSEGKEEQRPEVKEVPKSRRQERPSTVKKENGKQKK